MNIKANKRPAYLFAWDFPLPMPGTKAAAAILASRAPVAKALLRAS
jgi:hypothetical protein